MAVRSMTYVFKIVFLVVHYVAQLLAIKNELRDTRFRFHAILFSAF